MYCIMSAGQVKLTIEGHHIDVLSRSETRNIIHCIHFKNSYLSVIVRIISNVQIAVGVCQASVIPRGLREVHSPDEAPVGLPQHVHLVAAAAEGIDIILVTTDGPGVVPNIVFP